MRNSEERKAYQKAWRTANKDKCAETRRKYRREHPEQYKAQTKKDNAKSELKRQIYRIKSKAFSTFQNKHLPYKKEVLQLNSRGKTMDIIALRLNMPMSMVKTIIEQGIDAKLEMPKNPYIKKLR